jgi:hypothetical protein
VPTSKWYRRFEEQAAKLRNLRPTNPDFQWLQTYESAFLGETGDGTLTTRGALELYALGQRLRETYPLLLAAYNTSAFVLQSTAVPRCVLVGILVRAVWVSVQSEVEKRGKTTSIIFTHSHRAFRSGLSTLQGILEGRGSLGSCGYMPPFFDQHPLDRDTTLRFFTLCPRYIAEVKHDPVFSREHRSWADRHLISVAAGLNARVGVDSLDVDAVILLWTTCIVSALREARRLERRGGVLGKEREKG